MVRVAQKNPKLIVDEQSKEYWKWRDSILMHEEIMLEMLTFDLMVENPYQRLYEALTKLEMLHNRPIRDAAWAFCCDSALTVLPLLMNAREIAISAIFFATSFLREKIEDDPNGVSWWRALQGDESLTESAINVVCDFYSENPLRKSDSRYQGSPVYTLENTRRGRDFPSQTDAGSSHTGTPMGTDRGGTQSPRARLQQSRAERDDMPTSVRRMNEETGEDATMDLDTSSTKAGSDGPDEGRSNGLYGSKSPGAKRRSPEMDPDGGTDRDHKRARLEDEDEGEVLES